MSEGAAASHDVLLVAAAPPDCGRQSRSPRPIRVSRGRGFEGLSHAQPHCLSRGGAAGVIAEDDTLMNTPTTPSSGSDWLADQDAVEAFVQEAPRELLQLEHWGCPWSRRPNGRIAVRAFGGMKNMRTWFAADKTGFHMLHSLFQTSPKYPTSRGTTNSPLLGFSSTTDASMASWRSS